MLNCQFAKTPRGRSEQILHVGFAEQNTGLILARRLRLWTGIKSTLIQCLTFAGFSRIWPFIYVAIGPSVVVETQSSQSPNQQTQNICITFVQHLYVEDVGLALYKCYTNVLCLLGSRSQQKKNF